MFQQQLKNYRVDKYGKEIRPYGWNRDFKIGETRKGFYGVEGANMGGVINRKHMWKEKGLLGLLDSFYIKKRQKYENKGGLYRSQDPNDLGTSRFNDEQELDDYIYKFEDDIKRGIYDHDKPQSYKSERPSIRSRRKNFKGNKLGYNLGRKELNLFQEYKKN